MKIKNQIVLLTSITLFFSLSSTITLAAKKSDAVSACAAAENSRKAAAKVKMEWTTTGKLIKKGKKAIADGKLKEAVKFCEKAKFQGDASVKQAAIESAAWKSRVPQ